MALSVSPPPSASLQRGSDAALGPSERGEHEQGEDRCGLGQERAIGAVPSTNARVAATAITTAETMSAEATTTEARASARWRASGSARSVRKRQTRTTDPATSARTLNPRLSTPRLPASNPAVMDHAPESNPHTTEM